ncbi:peptide ABC transporter substrate-binding protein [Pseudochrobactrum asaccharolyticum]|uniref:Oligopeptide transport system substrate-binding protein n=1 Tax=Pseudochrobactrum asaccharolyticum TaxID=354351 RepID=A0A366E8L7_9HYPH|nr:peptide ABC transporter substrate-binding protein [Pseudochrobactrum asaccharolyticum]RBO98770.1 oligopeptide transport system substrate-binding protein [Pseudochrobactrum asaccharolyticum]
MFRPLLISGLLLSVFSNFAHAETVLNRGNDIDPSTLDQQLTVTVAEARLLSDLYQGLVMQDAKGAIIPGVAKSWEISPDGLTYIFKLRDNAKWSNGDPVTASDFVFTFQRIMDPQTAAPYANVLFPIKNGEAIATGKMPKEKLGVEALDEQTLKFTLEAPTPYFVQLMTHNTALPLNKKSVEANGKKFTAPGNLISNGAYQLVDFVPNDKITMKKNPYYYDADKVKIDVVNWLPFENRSSCMRRFEAKEVQICSDVAAEQMDYVKQQFGKQLHVAPLLGSYFLDIKGKDGSPLKDARVRRAISMAIDRDFIASEVWRGTMLPSYSLVPPGIDNYVSGGVKQDFANVDILDREDKAKALLKEAGVEPDSLTLELYYSTSENHKNVMAAVADMLKNIGIKAKLNELEGTTYFNFLREDGDFNLARDGWIGDYSDPQSFLFLYQTGNSFNYPKWSNKTYDSLLEKAAKTTDLKARADILADAERLLLKEQVIIPLLTYASRALVSDQVEGWQDNIMDVHATQWLSLK